MAAKTLVMLGLNDNDVNRRVQRYVLTPIMDMACDRYMLNRGLMN